MAKSRRNQREKPPARTGPAQVQPPAEPSEPRSEKLKTVTVRVPERIAQMLDLISLHKINGWRTPAAVLAADDCPLEAWLVPLYSAAVAATVKIQEELRREDG